MQVLRRSGRRAVVDTGSLLRLCPTRSASRINIPFAPSPLPVIESCPEPTCECRPMPALDIEREQNINGTMPTYAAQLLISTGRSDWKSRIEDDEDGVLLKQLKALLGPRGKYSDPYHNVMITNSSFFPAPYSTSQQPEVTSHEPGNSEQKPPSSASAFLLPSFKYLPSIPTDPSTVESFVRSFIKPAQLHQSYEKATEEERDPLIQRPELQQRFAGVRDVHEILVLICGHGNRDERCGTLGPLLAAEFEDKMKMNQIQVLQGAPATDAPEANNEAHDHTPAARVGLVSHIGGHKWAGNVIIYIPPGFQHNALAGKGIWLGRVEPKHVQFIVSETILGGKVIKDLFRGAIGQNGEVIRL